MATPSFGMSRLPHLVSTKTFHRPKRANPRGRGSICSPPSSIRMPSLWTSFSNSFFESNQRMRSTNINPSQSPLTSSPVKRISEEVEWELASIPSGFETLPYLRKGGLASLKLRHSFYRMIRNLNSQFQSFRTQNLNPLFTQYSLFYQDLILQSCLPFLPPLPPKKDLSPPTSNLFMQLCSCFPFRLVWFSLPKSLICVIERQTLKTCFHRLRLHDQSISFHLRLNRGKRKWFFAIHCPWTCWCRFSSSSCQMVMIDRNPVEKRDRERWHERGRDVGWVRESIEWMDGLRSDWTYHDE